MPSWFVLHGFSDSIFGSVRISSVYVRGVGAGFSTIIVFLVIGTSLVGVGIDIDIDCLEANSFLAGSLFH